MFNINDKLEVLPSPSSMFHQKMEFDHVDVICSEIAIYGVRDVQ